MTGLFQGEFRGFHTVHESFDEFAKKLVVPKLGVQRKYVLRHMCVTPLTTSAVKGYSRVVARMVARVTNVKYYVCSTGRSMLLIHTVRTDCSSLKYGNTYVSSAVRASRQQKESGILWLHRKTVSLVVRFIAANTEAPKQQRRFVSIPVVRKGRDHEPCTTCYHLLASCRHVLLAGESRRCIDNV